MEATVLEHERLMEVVGALSRVEIAALVSADLREIDEEEADQLGATFEVRKSLEAAGLLRRVCVDYPSGATRWFVTTLGHRCAAVVCPKCFTAMTSGKALIGPPRGITYVGTWPTRFSDCVKCHTCGHSEYLSKAT